MTFEEFFIKKKIDLDALQTDNPKLFSEFETHYQLMGNKSFDHTKKYWFNNLRKDFPLSDEKENELKESFKPKEIPKPDNTTKIAQEDNETTKKATGFKPRFKAPTEKNTEEIPSSTGSENELVSSPSAKPAGFKPRFKAGAPKPSQAVLPNLEEEIIPKNLEETKPEIANKPSGFKPRFKAVVTTPPEQNDDVANSSPAVSENEEEQKPLGFKPRFKATKPFTEVKEEEKLPSTEPMASKPLGFKPRFKK
ncbi:hypothetical protein I5M32_03350 [Pedobacter sp. SD-b]|uniref:Uncharacterized protein n=1 Tax=Pedobacter segetis TaxID=2793069 RepID=A0ABS1BIF6_9SPHI|nr:hypothetical protein [Pedobacter segetis]MBK0381984.1 hypothetical protein [Pedobacter segetis]